MFNRNILLFLFLMLWPAAGVLAAPGPGQRAAPMVVADAAIARLAPVTFVAGTELYRGLAGVIVGGMCVCTVFTLILLPALLRMGEASSEGAQANVVKVS